MANDSIARMRVSNPKSFELKKFDPAETFGWHKDARGRALQDVKVHLDKLQQRLAAENKRSLLLVLQARDAAGKDGTVRSIFSGLNPAGVQVTSFKVPAGREASQDYLWRVHAAVPATVRSVCSTAATTRTCSSCASRASCRSRCGRSASGTSTSSSGCCRDEGTTIVKCFLNVSKAEQAQRFQDRLDDPTKSWKFRAGDLADRKLWPKFQTAYEDAIRETSTSHAPWYVVPADHNWVRNLAVAKHLAGGAEEDRSAVPAAGPDDQERPGRVTATRSRSSGGPAVRGCTKCKVADS